MRSETIKRVATILDFVSENNYQKAHNAYRKTHKTTRNFRCPFSSDQNFLITLMNNAFTLSDDIALALCREWLHRGFHDDGMEYLKLLPEETFPTKQQLHDAFRIA